MNPGDGIWQLAFVALVALSVGGLVLALIYPLVSSGRPAERVKAIAAGHRQPFGRRRSGLGLQADKAKDNRRKQVQETLNQIEARAKQRRKHLSLRMLIAQTGLDLPVSKFWMFSAIVGGVLTLIPFLAGIPWYICVLSGFAGFLGLPRWFLGYLRKRRQENFLRELPDAIDVIVRGLRAGLPLSDAMRVIAAESGPPIGPEVQEVVEGQRVGIPIEQGFERMLERIPLQEVNFLSIVMGIQSKTGGNLTEALGNLSKVLRERRKMKSKIRAVSQEAKSSAAIIGVLPFVIMGAVAFISPGYLTPLISTSVGNTLLVISAAWMLFGVLVMRKMINFDI